MRKWFVRAGITLLAVFVAAGLIYHLALRGWCLRWGTTPAEARATLPGDELFPVYTGEATHAITIQAPPQQVWPWLMQIGQDRSGFYSYTFLENLPDAKCPGWNISFRDGNREQRARLYGSPLPSGLAGRAA
jgi:hypothetical protein